MFKIFKKGKLATGGSEPPKNEPPKNDPPPAAEPPKPEGADQTPEGAVTCPDCGAVLTPEKKADEPPAEDPAAYAANHQKYVEAFGADNGSKWFFSKVKFEEAQTLHFKAQLAAKDGEIASLKAELKTAKETLASVAKDGAKPFGSSPPPNGTEGGAKGSGGFSAVFKVKGS